jgi:hypothetical protein
MRGTLVVRKIEGFGMWRNAEEISLVVDVMLKWKNSERRLMDPGIYGRSCGLSSGATTFQAQRFLTFEALLQTCDTLDILLRPTIVGSVADQRCRSGA